MPELPTAPRSRRIAGAYALWLCALYVVLASDLAACRDASSSERGTAAAESRVLRTTGVAPGSSSSLPSQPAPSGCSAEASRTLSAAHLSQAEASFTQPGLDPAFVARAGAALGVPCAPTDPGFQPALAERLAAFQRRMSRFSHECSGVLDARTLRHLRMLFPALRAANDACGGVPAAPAAPLAPAAAARAAARNRDLRTCPPERLQTLQLALGASPAQATGTMDEATAQRIALFQADVARASPAVRANGLLDRATWDALTRAYPQLVRDGDAPPYLPACLLRWPSASPQQLQLMRRVYEIQRVRAAQKRTFQLAIDEMAEIDEGRWAPAEVAHRARRMLDAAREDRQAQRSAGRQALRIVFGYRSAPLQLEVWEYHIPAREKETRAQRSRLPNGAYGEDAARWLAEQIAGRTASPGYSLHNHGHALDLMCVLRDGRELGATSRFTPAWKRSWCWKWLTTHAADFGFRSNPSIDEPWHFEMANHDDTIAEAP